MDFSIKIGKEIFLGNAFDIAKDILLGAYLCTNIDDKLCVGRITEVEVYLSGEDKGSHTYKNKRTKRNSICYEQGGRIYVSYIYGIYNQFCITVGNEGCGDAILIRGLEPIVGIETMQSRRKKTLKKDLCSGPSKICMAMGIDINLYGQSVDGDLIWVCPKDKDYKITEHKRIGIDFAEEYADKLWRFLIV